MITHTASGLSAKLADLGLGKREEIMRVVRHYTAEGLLETVGAVNTGTGKKRTYPEEALLKAVILLRLNQLGVPIGVIRHLVRGLTKATDRKLSASLLEAVRHRLKRP